MSSTDNVRVLIVDDHLMVREGLRMFLSAYDDIEVVAEAEDGRQAVDLCAELTPDVVVMDMVMPDVDGPTATANILRDHPRIKVLALTSFAEEDLVSRAIEAGAIGYLHKDVHADRLAEAIRDAHRGQSTIDAVAARSLIEASSGVLRPGSDLTPRERQVLGLVVEGRTNRQIGKQLSISESTVRLHVSNILSKLGVANRTEAASLALKHKLV